MQETLGLDALGAWCPPGADCQHLQGCVPFEMRWDELQTSRSGIFLNSHSTLWWQFTPKLVLPAVKVFQL